MNPPTELDRYLALRQAGRNLVGHLTGRLPKQALPQGGKDLGLFAKNTLYLRNEGDMAVLSDYVLHQFLWEGKNSFEHGLANAPAALDPLERQFLEASAKARYSIVVIDNVVDNWGVNVQDYLYRDSYFINDQGLGSTASPGVVLATRILFFADFVITGGAPLTLPGVALQTIQAYLNQELRGRSVPDLPSNERQKLAAALIVLAVRRGATSLVQVR